MQPRCNILNRAAQTERDRHWVKHMTAQTMAVELCWVITAGTSGQHEQD